MTRSHVNDLQGRPRPESFARRSCRLYRFCRVARDEQGDGEGMCRFSWCWSVRSLHLELNGSLIDSKGPIM